MAEPALKLDHLYRLTDATGIYQHALGAGANPEFGYCLDDNVRALMVAIRAQTIGGDRALSEYVERYLAFTERALRPDGRFRNFMDAAGAWLEDTGSDDSNGRAIWGLGFAARYAADKDLRSRALRALAQTLPALGALRFLRAKAFSLLGLRHLLAAGAGSGVEQQADALGQDLARAFWTARGDNWRWFENELTYCNATLCEALIGGKWTDVGIESLIWLCETMTPEGVLDLIGNDGWYPRGGHRAVFDQQPVDAAAVSSACVSAFRATGDTRFEQWAKLAYAWFSGTNVIGERMIDDASGGCFDGLTPTGHNENQGAESLLAWLSTQEDMIELGWLGQ